MSFPWGGALRGPAIPATTESLADSGPENVASVQTWWASRGQQLGPLVSSAPEQARVKVIRRAALHGLRTGTLPHGSFLACSPRGISRASVSRASERYAWDFGSDPSDLIESVLCYLALCCVSGSLPAPEPAFRAHTYLPTVTMSA